MRATVVMMAVGAFLSYTGLSSEKSASAADKAGKPFRVYVGTFTSRGGSPSQGIYRFEFDPMTGKATAPSVAVECENPSFLTISSDGQRVYSVLAVSELNGQKGTGGVRAYRVSDAEGNLTALNTQLSHGSGPCHVSLDASEKTLLIANYGAGATAATYRVLEDGSISPAVSTVQHDAASENKDSSRKAHGHSIHVLPNQKYAVVCDAGLDVLKVYPFDKETGKLDAANAKSVPTKDRAAPRHFAVHPNKQFAYHNNEADLTVTFHKLREGELIPQQTLSTVPGEWTRKDSTAEVVVHPSGKFLYVSNRGPDSLAIFAIQPDGKLRSVGYEPTLGKIPRNFVIDPTGNYLLAANQNSNDIFVFKIDLETGKLTSTGEGILIPNPVCVRFVAPR